MSWASLNKAMEGKTEEELLQMLREEQTGGNRPTYLIRLHQKWSAKRVARERKELLNDARK